ncbi:MAG: RHS repeat-associated core domain-containing protein, partial [Tepidisphaeraceae bacterium]
VDDQNVSTLKNRYLHGPGVDDVLAEEAVRDFTLSTTTVTLDGFGNPDLDGARDVSLYPAGGPDYWYGTWSTGEMSMFRSAGGTGWEAYVYDYNNGTTIYFANASASATPPTSGWSYQWDDWGMYPGAEIDAVASTTGTGWRTHWLLGDHQGSVRQVIDDAGAVKDKLDYDAFGNVKSETNRADSPRFGYTGQERDAGTGLVYMGGRYYDPASGTMLSPDLPVESGGDMNGHRYVYNMPVDGTDPSGWSANFGNDFSLGDGWTFGGGGSTSGGSSFHYSTSYDDPFSLAPSPYVSSTTPPTTMPSTMPVAPAMAPVDFSTSYLRLENSSSPELRALAARYKAVIAAAMNANVSDADAQARAEYMRSGPSMRPMTAAESRRANSWVAQQREWQDLDLAIRGPYHEAEANALRGDAFVKGDSQVMFDVAVDVTNAFGGQMRSGGGTQTMARRGPRRPLYGQAFSIRINPHVPGRPDPRFSIDTSTFPGVDRTTNGGVRNAPEFWRQWQAMRPETISPTNAARIAELQRNARSPSPRVDDVWLQHFPEHASYTRHPNNVLIHHHVDQGAVAIPVPRGTHPGYNREWHGR